MVMAVIDFLMKEIGTILGWVKEYGVFTFLTVAFFWLYIKSQKRNEKLQDARLDDSKNALTALVEARAAFTELAKNSQDIENKLDKVLSGKGCNFEKERN